MLLSFLSQILVLNRPRETVELVQAGLKLMKDRRLEVALKAFGKLGNSLERLTERLEELGEKVGLTTPLEIKIIDL